jgi:hypothetical protein
MNSTTAPTNTMGPGWSLGRAKPRHAVRIFHYFKGADNISLCKRVVRNATHPVSDSVDSGLRCAKCNERHKN